MCVGWEALFFFGFHHSWEHHSSVWVNPDAGPRPVGQGIHVRKKSAQGSHRAGFDNRGTYRCSLPLSSDRFDLVRLRNGRHRYRFYVISYAITYSDTLVRLPQEVSSVAGVLFVFTLFFWGSPADRYRTVTQVTQCIRTR